MMKKTFKILGYGVLFCFLLYAYRFRILGVIDNVFYKDYELQELTMEEKLEDFEMFYNTIVSSVPFLDESEELYKIDFIERKEYYIQEIMSTDNNVEFYGVISAIAEDIGSFHTDVCFPLYSNLRGLNCYQSKETLAKLGMKAKLEAWTRDVGALVNEYENVSIINVEYIDGTYVVDENDIKNGERKGYELVSVEGINADEYITQNISIYGIHYDYLKRKVYREKYIFNDSVGKKITVIWRNSKGEEIGEELYVDYGVNLVYACGYLYTNQNGSSVQSDSSIYTYRDDVNQLEYIKIDNFDNLEGKSLRKYLENITYDTVIIDLRENYGGKCTYGEDYIFPALYDVDVTHSFSWKVPNSEANRAMIDDWIVKFLYPCEKEGEWYYYSDGIKYNGEAKGTRKVYYLVGPSTGSAADGYVAMIKENGLGKIIGENTGGEGLGASFVCDSLKNSSLVYIYYPAGYTANEQDNSCTGTTPDIYVYESKEDYLLRKKYQAEGTALQYENRLVYDTVLKWIVNNGDSI